jgi:ankyrin repeat protein
MAQTIERVKEHTYVKQNQPHEVKKLLKQKSNAIYVRDEYDQTMLHVAAFEGRIEIVNIILSKCKIQDLKIRDKNGWTPLHCAAIQGNYDICELLLKKGAPPNAQNSDLASPFYYLCR